MAAITEDQTPPDVWQWLDNSGWVDYAPDVSKRLSAGEVVVITAGRSQYRIEPSAMHQVNMKTGYRRQIRNSSAIAASIPNFGDMIAHLIETDGEGAELLDPQTLSDAIDSGELELDVSAEGLRALQSQLMSLKKKRRELEADGSEKSMSIARQVEGVELTLKRAVLKRSSRGAKAPLEESNVQRYLITANWKAMGIDRYQLDRNGNENRDTPIRYRIVDIIL